MTWVFQFQTKEKLESLNRIKSSVDKVTHENVSCIWNLSTLVEKFEEIIELSMDVTAYGHWCLNWLEIALFYKDFFYFFTQDS